MADVDKVVETGKVVKTFKRGKTTKVPKTITKLERVRKVKNLTRRELSELSGVPERMIRAYEDETRKNVAIAIWYYIFMAKALGCKLIDIIDPIKGAKTEKLKTKFLDTKKKQSDSQNVLAQEVESLNTYIEKAQAKVAKIKEISKLI